MEKQILCLMLIFNIFGIAIGHVDNNLVEINKLRGNMESMNEKILELNRKLLELSNHVLDVSNELNNKLNEMSRNHKEKTTMRKIDGTNMYSFRFSSGDLYEGEFNDSGQMHGYGKMKYLNGDTYDGFWAYNKKHGRGHYLFDSGKWINAYFKNDERYCTYDAYSLKMLYDICKGINRRGGKPSGGEWCMQLKSHGLCG